MSAQSRERALGLGLVAFAILLIAVIVPVGVPTQPGPLILRADLWPRVVSWGILIFGAAIAARAFLAPVAEPAPPEDDARERAHLQGMLRLVGLGAILLGLAWGTSEIGMVWAGMLAFWAILAMIRPRRVWIAALVGLLLPLALYGFFSHFAGVPIPQGSLVRLP